jgi:hypothetical protein
MWHIIPQVFYCASCWSWPVLLCLVACCHSDTYAVCVSRSRASSHIVWSYSQVQQGRGVTVGVIFGPLWLLLLCCSIVYTIYSRRMMSTDQDTKSRGEWRKQIGK